MERYRLLGIAVSKDWYPVTSEGSASVFRKSTFSSSSSAKKEEGVSFRAERISRRLVTEGDVWFRSIWEMAPLVRPARSARSAWASPLICRRCLILAPMSINTVFLNPPFNNLSKFYEQGKNLSREK